jgi:CHAD domain-containing protein
LRWLADALGEARDAEVMHERLRELLRAEPPELVLGPVVARIDSAMTRRRRKARARLGEALDSERYLLLLDALDELAADPPFLPAARHAARPALAHLLRRTWRRIDRSMTRAQRGAQDPGGDELLHQVRKDAKRMRYAAEAVQPVFGRPAGRFAS